MLLVGGLSFILGIALVYAGTWANSPMAFWMFIGLGILSLLAAYFYTAGKKSYGYIGLGDLSVFLFFGLLPVIGTFFLHTNFSETAVILPAISMGFFSAGVLNLNNMRDIQNDRQSGKITMAVKMGSQNSRLYHMALIALGWITVVVFTLHQQESAWQWLFLLALPLFVIDLVKIYNTRDDRLLDPFLKRLALSTLAFTLLFSTGLILAL
jgi:1,4-dihydroxy-2-naphthoate octaprenyltransferase